MKNIPVKNVINLYIYYAYILYLTYAGPFFFAIEFLCKQKYK